MLSPSSGATPRIGKMGRLGYPEKRVMTCKKKASKNSLAPLHLISLIKKQKRCRFVNVG
jgi:hypothetical protein